SALVERGAPRDVPGVSSGAASPSRHPRVDAHPAAVRVGGVPIGAGAAPVILAGPCAVESERQIFEAAERVARAGARFLRGGAFKPRTSPYTFQGHGARALGWLRRAADAHGLAGVTEATTPEDARA